jgi:hypothetical protein
MGHDSSCGIPVCVSDDSLLSASQWKQQHDEQVNSILEQEHLGGYDSKLNGKFSFSSFVMK